MLIRLVGCMRYSYKGELFEKGFDYDLDNPKSKILLGLADDYGRPYFIQADNLPDVSDGIEVEGEEEEESKVEVRRKRGRPRKDASAKVTPKKAIPKVRKSGTGKVTLPEEPADSIEV